MTRGTKSAWHGYGRRALLTRFGPSLPEDANTEAYTWLAGEYQGEAQRLEVVALRKEHVGLVATRHGETSREVLKPLQDLAWAQWSAGELEGLKQSVDRPHAAWLRQAAEPDALANRDRRLLIDRSGFHAVFGLRIVAFREDAFAAVAPQIEEVFPAMRSILGDTDPFVQAAQFHQREVVTGRAVGGSPIGGGFMPDQY